MRSITAATLTGLALASLAACTDSATRLAGPDATSTTRLGASALTPALSSSNQAGNSTGDHGPMDKITICHAAGRLGTTKYVEITVSRNASYAHLDEHGTPMAGHEEDYYAIPGQGCGTPPGPTLIKDLVGVMMAGPTPGSMLPDPSWTTGSTLVVIPIGQTRWLEWQLTYILPSGVTGTISENAQTVCGSLGTFVLQCTFNENPVTYPIYSWSGLSGTGTVPVMTDLGGGGAGSCGEHTFINTALLTPSAGLPVTASKQITIRVVCP